MSEKKNTAADRAARLAQRKQRIANQANGNPDLIEIENENDNGIGKVDGNEGKGVPAPRNEENSNDANMDGNNNNNGPPPRPPGLAPSPGPENEFYIPTNAHPDAGMRAIARDYKRVQKQHRIVLHARATMRNGMLNWTAPAIDTWVRREFPVAQLMVSRVRTPAAKRMALWQAIELHHGQVLQMVDEMKGNLVRWGFDEVVLEYKGEGGREEKNDQLDHKSDGVYDPRDDLNGKGGAAAKNKSGKKVTVVTNEHGKNGDKNGKNNGIGNHNGGATQPTDPGDSKMADASVAAQLQALQQRLAAQDAKLAKMQAENVKLKKKKKDPKLDPAFKPSPRTARVLENYFKKRTTKVSYSSVLVVVSFSCFVVFVGFFLF